MVDEEPTRSKLVELVTKVHSGAFVVACQQTRRVHRARRLNELHTAMIRVLNRAPQNHTLATSLWPIVVQVVNHPDFPRK